MFDCENCGKEFTRADNRNRHMQNSCKGKRIKLDVDSMATNCRKCDICEVYVEKKCFNSHLRSNLHRSNAFTIVDDGVEKVVGAFGDRIVSYRVSGQPKHYVNVEEFADDVKERVMTLVDSILGVHDTIKMNLELFGLYYLMSKENVEIKSFNTRNKIINHGSDIYKMFEDYMNEIITKMSEFQERDSGTHTNYSSN